MVQYVSIPKMVRLIGFFSCKSLTRLHVSIPKIGAIDRVHIATSVNLLSRFNSKDGAIDRRGQIEKAKQMINVSIPKMVRLIAWAKVSSGW